MPRVNIVLPEDILEQMDQIAREEGMNRSQLVRTSFLVYFNQRAENNLRQQRQADIQYTIDIQDSLSRSVPSWDPIKLLRQQRQAP